jgi:hypothetical protein
MASTHRHQCELLFAFQSSCPRIHGMPGQRFPTAGWGSSLSGGQEIGGEITRGEYPEAEPGTSQCTPGHK